MPCFVLKHLLVNRNAPFQFTSKKSLPDSLLFSARCRQISCTKLQRQYVKQKKACKNRPFLSIVTSACADERPFKEPSISKWVVGFCRPKVLSSRLFRADKFWLPWIRVIDSSNIFLPVEHCRGNLAIVLYRIAARISMNFYNLAFIP